jgi:STAM-binding protein
MHKFSTHPDLRQSPISPAVASALRRAKDDVNKNLVHLELLKPRIKKRYEAYMEMMSRLQADRESWTRESQEDPRSNAFHALTSGQRVSTDVGNKSRFSVVTGSEKSEGYLSGGYGRAREVDPEEGKDLAVQLAHNEFRNGAGTAAANIAWEESPKRNKNSRTSGNIYADDSDDDLSSRIRDVGIRREQAFAKAQEAHIFEHVPRPGPKSRAPQYPSVPKHSDPTVPTSNTAKWYGSSPGHRKQISNGSSSPPARPPKEQSPGSDISSYPPPIPLKQSLSPPDLVEAPDTSRDSTLDPKKFTFKPTAFTESGTPLRTVFMNSRLRSRFLTIALANTSRGLETCGILCGRLLSNAFFVFKLVIPEQESTSDTCETINEGALFDYCDKEDLLTLGWIHTHPTQTCFMSSRDLHTHGGYQVQLAESVAIVCAPRHEPS